jgi:Domain of unknown function (DUF4395)
MSAKIFEFGQIRPEYAVPVLNERAVRAAAGILFFLALVSFMNAWLLGNFQPTRVFVVGFLIEFSIRTFINPRYAPVMILGEWVVRKQTPEWTGAPQKRFAWGIGFVLAAAMLYLLVLNNVVGPINMIVCSVCLLLLFFETAFGICVGCQIYNGFNKEKAQLCPGGVCEMAPQEIPRMSLAQGAVLVAFAVTVFAIAQWVYGSALHQSSERPKGAATAPAAATPVDAAEEARCKVPSFAQAIGHAEMWKRHNNCQ